MQENYLWSEKYRPHSIDDCILPQYLKDTFTNFVITKELPNLMFCGPPGVGKTTVAKAILDQIGADYIVINGSMNGNIDTLRVDIKNFASTVSFSSVRKFVILDEADNLTTATQLALRGFIEEFSSNCGFILTCNYKNRILEAIHSRCPPVEFKIAKEDRPKLAAQMFKRATSILDKEHIDYDKAVIAEVISKHFPDFRRILNTLQQYSATGKIDSGILSSMIDDNFKVLIDNIKSKNFNEVRKWVSDNSDIDTSVFFRHFYDTSHTLVVPNSVPQLVLILADYQYKSAFVADQEINMLACVIEIMADVEFK